MSNEAVAGKPVADRAVAAKVRTPSPSPKVTATKLTFALALLCIGIVGYAAVAYVHFSFSTNLQTSDLSLFIVRQRTTLSALAICIGLSCIIMGIGVFMIGAKGEIKFSAENPWFKGALVSGVPGPFFVLCGTVITIQVLSTRVSHEELATVVEPTNPPVPSPSAAGSAGLPHVVALNRTIAGAEQLGLLATSRGASNTMFAMTHPEGTDAELSNDIKYLRDHRNDVRLVKVDWDPDAKRPRGALHAVDGQVVEFSGEGVLFVPQVDVDAELVTQVVGRWSTSASDPHPITEETALRQTRGALFGADSYNPRTDK